MIAETREQAADAAELVEVEYEQLPSVTEVDDALKPARRRSGRALRATASVSSRFGDAAEADAAFTGRRALSSRSTSYTSA